MGNETVAVNIIGISYSLLKPGYKNWLENQIDGPFLVVSHSLIAVLPGKECKSLSVGVMFVWGGILIMKEVKSASAIISQEGSLSFLAKRNTQVYISFCTPKKYRTRFARI